MKTSVGLNASAWAKIIVLALPSLVGVILGGTITLVAQWMKWSSDRQAKRLDDREAMDAVVFRACLALPSNIFNAAALLTAFRYERDQSGEMQLAHIAKLSKQAANLRYPLREAGLEAKPISCDFRRVFKHLARADHAVATVTAFWSRDYLEANREPSKAKLAIEELVEAMMEQHAWAMHYIAIESGLAGFQDIWDPDEVKQLRDAVSCSHKNGVSYSDRDAVPTLTKLLDALAQRV